MLRFLRDDNLRVLRELSAKMVASVVFGPAAGVDIIACTVSKLARVGTRLKNDLMFDQVRGPHVIKIYPILSAKCSPSFAPGTCVLQCLLGVQ